MSHSIRPARSADIPAILRILAASPTAPQWSAAEFQAILKPTEPDTPLQRAIWIAEKANQPAAFAVASTLPPEAELENIAVVPTHRGQGLGRALLNTVAAWSATSGADTLRLEVRSTNTPALHLYRAAGFLQTGKRPAYYANPTDDALCMARTIQPVGNTTGVA